jgi:hypothetical protein
MFVPEPVRVRLAVELSATIVLAIIIAAAYLVLTLRPAASLLPLLLLA